MQRVIHRTRFFTLAALALAAGCVTVNIYFPTAKVEKTAEKIVKDVYQEPEGTSPPEEGKPQSSLEEGIFRVLSWLGPASAYAEEATTVSNAAIRALKDQIAQRHRQLLPYYEKGQVGIGQDGFLEVRSTDGLALPQVATLKRLVDADNAARRQLYEEVARALGLKPDQVPQVRQIFAKQWRDKAQAGWAIQTDDGKWVRR